MTRQICVAALAAAAFMLWQPAQAHACSCAPPPDITTQWGAMPDAVVAARVTSEFTIGAKKIYVAKVRKAFKGCAKKGDRLYIVTRTSSAACGVTLGVGGTYLLGDEAQPLSAGRWLMNLSLCDLHVKWSQLSKDERSFLNARQVCCDGSCACADGSDPVQCFVDPCEVAPPCPGGKCEANFCGGCNAEFYDKSGNALCLPCSSNADCAAGEVCNGGQCQEGCTEDADCPADAWCSPTQDGSTECKPFQQEGDWCGGFTPVWAQSKCAPGLICTDFPPFVADAPGICRKECNDNGDCAEEQYCSPDDVCRDDGACFEDNHCDAPGNNWPHIECVGYAWCTDDGQCAWNCGEEPEPTCDDLSGYDFGACLAILGIGVIDGSCTWISGCSADGVGLFDTFEECEAACNSSSCKDDKDCATDEYCATDGECAGDGTCGNNADCNLPGNSYPAPFCIGYGVCEEGQCGWQCGDPPPSCDDLGDVDFGDCEMVLGVGVVNGQCTYVSGCGALGYSFFTSIAECEAECKTGGCEYNDKWYEPGDSFPAGDGCNTCSCLDNGNVICTLIACQAGCEYGGSWYEPGDSFPADDGCNTCFCQDDGSVACTEMACAGCEVDGKWFAPGDTFPAGDGCNTCSCGDNGMVACTKIGCFIGCTAEQSCQDNWSMCWAPGQDLPCGACFLPDNTCNVDTECGEGNICTMDTSSCLCEPANTCQPGCKSGSDCEEGESCHADGHCKPTECSGANDCPLNFDCTNGECKRRWCSASTECWGFCVNGQCYTESGYCSPPPP